MTTLVPPGSEASLQAVLKGFYDAISDLQNPGAPVALPHVDLKVATSTQSGLPLAADWPECGIVCDEINSLVVSTKVAGTYAWLRADGGAL